MNLGIQDAVDLATTLAEAEDSGDPNLLDGYEQRRRPVARDVVRFTDRTTRAASLRSPVARRLRNLALAAVLRAPGRQQRLAHQPAATTVTNEPPGRTQPGVGGSKTL